MLPKDLRDNLQHEPRRAQLLEVSLDANLIIHLFEHMHLTFTICMAHAQTY